MARGDKAKLTDDRGGPLTFPPELVDRVRSLPAAQRLASWPDAMLSELLVIMFFASMRAEEHEHYPLRVVLAESTAPAHREDASDAEGWRVVRLHPAVPLSARQLVRLARATSSERIHIVVGAGERLMILGLGYEPGEGSPERLRFVAPEPGSLEVWAGRQRLLDYAQGRVMEPPENVLLAAGNVRVRLRSLSSTTGLPEYIECLTSLVRHMTEHAHGGILIVGASGLEDIPHEAGFILESGLSIGAVLARLGSITAIDESTRRLVEGSLRSELDRTLAEVGRLTALDGATILDARLDVLGFGVILPIVEKVRVLEAADAAATTAVPFPLRQFGARHRAAASYAGTHPNSLVFVASADGDIACMIREPESPHVLVWRFRSGDLSRDGALR